MSSKKKDMAVKKDFKFQFSVEDLNKEVLHFWPSLNPYISTNTSLPVDTL